jgi:hypothetical protein
MTDPSTSRDRRGASTLAIAWLLFGMLCLAGAQAQTTADPLQVGGVTIEAPSLPGFNEITKVSPDVVALAQTMIPATNRLLGVYLSDWDYEKLVNGEAPDFDRYMFIQVHRELENKNISRSDFGEISTQLKAQQDTILDDVREDVGKIFDSASDQISKDYDVSLDMQLGDQKSLGVFLDQPNAVAFTSLVKYQGSLEGESFDYVMAGSTMLMKVKRRLLYVYVYSQYETQADVDWVESRTSELANLILTTNHAGADSDDDFGDSFLSAIDFGGVVNSGIIGAIVGGFVALMFVLFGGSKRRAEKRGGGS